MPKLGFTYAAISTKKSFCVYALPNLWERFHNLREQYHSLRQRFHNLREQYHSLRQRFHNLWE
ncbi:MAG: hypothetical protein ACYTX0_42125, partial [Nostoc sp.]